MRDEIASLLPDERTGERGRTMGVDILVARPRFERARCEREPVEFVVNATPDDVGGERSHRLIRMVEP